jgi:peroxiredoxin|tara:strand:- start:3167 stop:4294 length:1128 start_codon:yes stop_codon:yes gene_type:complete
MIQKNFQLFILLLLFACTNNSKHFIINAETDRVGDAILSKIASSNNIIDTVSIKNGQFSFKKSIKEEELFRLQFHDGSSFQIATTPGEKIKVNFKEQNLSISGSTGTEKLMELDEKLIELVIFRDSITKKLQSLSRDDDYENIMLEHRELFFNRLNEHKEYLKKFIDENKDSKVSLAALFQTYGKSNSVLTVDEDLEDFEKVLKNLKAKFPQSKDIELLENQILKFKPLANGQPAPIFSLPNLDGETISLSDYKGKIILVDFWASWCKPCRIENPKLVKLYNKYSDLDFEIISISLDGTPRQKNPEEDWKKAIETDNLTQWEHLSELTGWQTYVREMYNLNSIPYTVLIDREGKIIAKNLRGADLEIKIKNLLTK